MPVEVFVNDAVGTVVSGGTNAPAPGTVQTWTVSAINPFPAASSTAVPATSFYVADQLAANETEKILVTNISGSTWTVTRGADGTTPVNHNANFTIVQVVTGGSLRALRTWSSDWLDAVTQYGADPTGVADSTAAIQAALNAAGPNGTVYLPGGTYKLNSTSGLSMLGNTTLTGAGPHLTSITGGASFTGSWMIRASIGATISNMSLTMPNATISANPAADAIYATQNGQFIASVTVSNVSFSNINGWCFHLFDDGTSGAPVGFVLQNLSGAGAGGIGIFGAQRTLGGLMLLDAGVAANGGTSTTLDGLLIQDAFDVECINSWLATGGTCTGHTIHLVGHVTNLRFAKGEYNSTSTAGSGSCNVKIEHGVNGDPSQAYFEGMTFQAGDIGVSLQGSCSDIKFAGCEFNSMNTHGVIQNSTGTNLVFDNCGFGTPGAYASNGGAGPTLHGTYYDLNWSGTGFGRIDGCVFASSIVAVSSAGVQGSIAFPSGNATQVVFPVFNGSGAAVGNWFTNFPPNLVLFDSWHAVTLQNSWTGTLRAKLTGRLVYLNTSGVLTPGTKTDGTVIGTVSTGYIPASIQNVAASVDVIAGAAAQSPHLNIDTAGNIKCFGCASAGALAVNESYALD